MIEAGDVVEDLRSEAESNFSYLGFTGVERDGDFEFAAKSLQRWKEPAEFFVGGMPGMMPPLSWSVSFAPGALLPES